MRYIKSCGFIVFTVLSGERRYLIIKSHNGDVGFPKGHVEEGESEIETALRELMEETGVDVRVIDGFRRRLEYELPDTPDAMKEVVYFLGECLRPEALTPQESEVAEATFLPFADAVRLLTFDQTKRLLFEAEEFITR